MEIFLFKKDGITTNSEFYLSHPPFIKHYITNKPLSNFVMICVNDGTKSKSANFKPLCEILFISSYKEAKFKEIDKKILFNKEEDSGLYKHINESLYFMYGKTIRDIPFGIEYKGQIINEKGLVTWLNYENKHIGLLEPLHSQLLNLDEQVYIWSKKEIIQLGLKLGVNYSIAHSCYDPTIKNNYGQFRRNNRLLIFCIWLYDESH
jgi:hypothetical protein